MKSDLSLRIVRSTRDVVPEQTLDNRTPIARSDVEVRRIDLHNGHRKSRHHNPSSVACLHVAVKKCVQAVSRHLDLRSLEARFRRSVRSRGRSHGADSTFGPISLSWRAASSTSRSSRADNSPSRSPESGGKRSSAAMSCLATPIVEFVIYSTGRLPRRRVRLTVAALPSPAVDGLPTSGKSPSPKESLPPVASRWSHVAVVCLS